MITSSYEHTDYFPDEAFDPGVVEAPDGVELANSYGHFVNRLRDDARKVVGEDKEHLSLDDEQLLAQHIQAGLQAATRRQELGEDYDGSLDDIIREGEAAKRVLVTANLPYAAYFASASMGEWYDPRGVKVPGIPRPYKAYLGHLKKIGAWAPVAELANSRADLEDRTMVAIEAMWRAADSYKPVDTHSPSKKEKARFITYATWWMHGALQRHSVTEVAGWDVSSHVLAEYIKEMRDVELGKEPGSRGYHVVDGKYHFKLSYGQVLDGRQGVPLQSVTATAPEESDHFGEPTPIHIDDLTVDRTVDVGQRVERQDLRRELAVVLGTLEDQEAEVIRARYGLKDGVPKSLDDIAKQDRITRERARQIESKAMSKLRHRTRSARLEDYVTTDEMSMPPVTMEPHAKGTMQIRTRRATEKNPE